MERKKQEAVLEAILFTMGESVELMRLAELIDASPKKTKEILEDMRKRWQEEERGVTLIALEDSWQMCTVPEMYEYLIRIAKTPKKYTLTDTLLETLSIIAYRQPVTRLDVERIRGVSCDHAINRLKKLSIILQEPGISNQPAVESWLKLENLTLGAGKAEQKQEKSPY